MSFIKRGYIVYVYNWHVLLANAVYLLFDLLASFFLFLRYEERIDRVETRIAARLRDQLGSARNANEMFRIFSRYNVLFVRPHIRGAIREYQTQLIQRVKEDIDNLHKKFKVRLILGCVVNYMSGHGL